MSAPLIRVAIVTGAAQGLGLAIALRLADDGLDVAVNDISAKREELKRVVSEIQAKGRRCLAVTADVSLENEVREMVGRVVNELGGLDVMVANAGVVYSNPLTETSVEEWERTMSVNLRGAMLSYKYAAQQMIKQGRGGRIIGASSIAGKKGFPNLASYCASKFAIRGLTQCTALDLRPYDITVNAYAPGMIMTSLADHPDDAINGGRGSTWKKTLGLPLTHPQGEPDAIASIVSYLAKSESYFITGECEPVKTMQ
ncbi:NAD(P)-binding protein [Obba rivulosa]|uniref:NAD(P)-binding protein n=1 Tax=Obba rivulosa TaxID=1052685 RepID=A0A8E2DJA9_9APHY|nr:NAD(P)-binding protein [Obba rivulosa]